MKNKKNAFTLIELIAVLVILAILALIVTPLVLNIVRSAKDSANKRSVDAYGRSVELAIASYLLETNEFPSTLDNLKIEYSGNEVICGIQELNEDSSVYLSECTVGGTKVKDSSTDDGWYHYGKANSTTYKSYQIGDIITYNGMNFYVIADSDKNSDTVTILKAEPLTVDEVNTYGVGHVNKYTYDSIGTASNQNGYGGMAYYTSETCGYPNGLSDSWVNTGCTTDYAKSEVKYVVDAWAADTIKSADLTEDTTGYSARLITYDELFNNLGYNKGTNNITSISVNKDDTPDWVYNSNYYYWTMTQYNDSVSIVWRVSSNSNLDGSGSYYYSFVAVRPVITLKKSSLS